MFAERIILGIYAVALIVEHIDSIWIYFLSNGYYLAIFIGRQTRKNLYFTMQEAHVRYL